MSESYSDPCAHQPGNNTADGPRPRVLLIAEACNPDWTSVPLVGYNLYAALRQVTDVTLVTQVRNREALSSRLPADAPVAYINNERIAKPLYTLGNLLTLGRGLGWTTRQVLMWPAYLYFEYLVYRRFGEALRRGEFDLIHRVTPLSPTYPSPLAAWCDTPMILGPLNGGLPWPKGTTAVRLAELEWASYFRAAYKALPYMRATWQRAAAFIAGSQHTLHELPPAARRKARYIPENAIHPERFNAAQRTWPSRIRPFRIAFVGRLVPYKGADVVIEAFAASGILRQQAELLIIGDGPQRPELEAAVQRHGLADRVRLAGNLPQEQVARQLAESSLFAFPSIREFGGAVVMEAMACGLPCVVVNYGGPGEYIDDATGIRLPLSDRPQRITALRVALEQLHAQPERLDAMSRAARDKALNLYTWTAKAQAILHLYQHVLQTCPAAR